MRPWPTDWTILANGTTVSAKGKPCNYTYRYEGARPNFARRQQSFDPYDHWFETWYQELKEDDRVIPKDFDYLTPWDETEVILIDDSTMHFDYKGKRYKRFPKKYCDLPRYFIDESGEVLSFAKETINVLKPNPTGHGGYHQISIFNKNVRSNPVIHRIVADTFIGDCTGKQIDHIDTVTSNNHVSNLQIVTPEQNIYLRDARSETTFVGKMSKLFGFNVELPDERLDIVWE